MQPLLSSISSLCICLVIIWYFMKPSKLNDSEIDDLEEEEEVYMGDSYLVADKTTTSTTVLAVPTLTTTTTTTSSTPTTTTTTSTTPAPTTTTTTSTTPTPTTTRKLTTTTTKKTPTTTTTTTTKKSTIFLTTTSAPGSDFITTTSSPVPSINVRYIRVEATKNVQLHADQIVVFDQFNQPYSLPETAASLGPANKDPRFAAKYLVDGYVPKNPRRVWSTHGLAHTAASSSAFLQVDLGADKPVSKVMVYNRSENFEAHGSRLADSRLRLLTNSRTTARQYTLAGTQRIYTVVTK